MVFPMPTLIHLFSFIPLLSPSTFWCMLMIFLILEITSLLLQNLLASYLSISLSRNSAPCTTSLVYKFFLLPLASFLLSISKYETFFILQHSSWSSSSCEWWTSPNFFHWCRLGGNSDGRTFTSTYIPFFGAFKKQKWVAHSTEIGHRAVNSCSAEVLWIKNLY